MSIISEIIDRRKRRVEIQKLDDKQFDKAVKIQGTKYDRKRKLSDWEIKRLREYFRAGVPVNIIAKAFSLNATTVRYNVDDAWRIKYNASRNGKHTGKDTITFEDRVAYKRQLVSSKKISV